jgi:anti-anti-sigma factor
MQHNGIFLNEKNLTLEVNGSIHFDNVVHVLTQSQSLLQQLVALKIDLKGLVHCDSSAIALLIAWVRDAKKQHKSIQFLNMPKFMQAILTVCDLESVLPILWEN